MVVPADTVRTDIADIDACQDLCLDDLACVAVAYIVSHETVVDTPSTVTLDSCSGWDCENIGDTCTDGGYTCCSADSTNGDCTDGSCWHSSSDLSAAGSCAITSSPPTAGRDSGAFTFIGEKGCVGRNEICDKSQSPCTGATSLAACDTLCASDVSCISYEWKATTSECQLSTTCTSAIRLADYPETSLWIMFERTGASPCLLVCSLSQIFSPLALYLLTHSLIHSFCVCRTIRW